MEHRENEAEKPPVQVARMIDAPAPRARLRAPLVTLALLAANLLMALAQFAAGGFEWRGGEIGSDLSDWALGAKVPSLIAHGEYWRLVTANFLHGSWVPHLLFNMLGLLALGRLIEVFYGPARLLVIYVLSCVAGAVASYLFTPSVSLGASTGVLGLMGALLVHNHRYREHLPHRINAVYPLLLFLLLVQFAMELSSQTIDTWGHVGGLVGGGVMALLLEARIAGPLQDERDWVPLPTALATAIALLAYGAFGLLTTLPNQVELLRAGTTADRMARIAQLERVLRQRPYFVEARVQLGDTLLSVGRPYDALRQFQQALKTDPESELINRRLTLFHLERARIAYEAGQWAAALDAYRDAIDQAKDDVQRAQGHNGFAWVLADKLHSRLDEAEKHAQTATRLFPGNAAIIDTLAWIYYHQQRYPQALEEQTKAVRLAEAAGEADAELYFHLGAIYEKLGQREDAVKQYKRALRLRPVYPDAARGLQRLAEPSTPDRTVPAPSGREEFI
jgi:rhomboid protease GluP